MNLSLAILAYFKVDNMSLHTRMSASDEFICCVSFYGVLLLQLIFKVSVVCI